jgi:hypothetical protein
MEHRWNYADMGNLHCPENNLFAVPLVHHQSQTDCSYYVTLKIYCTLRSFAIFRICNR